MPVVSHRVMPWAPASASRRASRMTSPAGTSPSKGQPKAVDSETLHGTPASPARRRMAASSSKDWSRVMRRLARLWVSLHDMTRFISSVPASSARSSPQMLGMSAV
ncbi:Uncharacterised protein [Bordetella pertussis]|nr:Uncharacterised protein [Bordetella pertussis]